MMSLMDAVAEARKSLRANHTDKSGAAYDRLAQFHQDLLTLQGLLPKALG